LPTLRERRADVLELATHFLDRHRTTRLLRLSTAAADALLTYEWPGNVRELERLMERAVALASTNVIELDDLPPTVRGDYAVAVLPSLERDEACGRGAAGMRGWCSNAVTGTSERPAACLTSAITPSRLISAFRWPARLGRTSTR
jgi:DNA-binding NtrC family response regulator